jgi:hypothetical protein
MNYRWMSTIISFSHSFCWLASCSHLWMSDPGPAACGGTCSSMHFWDCFLITIVCAGGLPHRTGAGSLWILTLCWRKLDTGFVLSECVHRATRRLFILKRSCCSWLCTWRATCAGETLVPDLHAGSAHMMSQEVLSRSCLHAYLENPEQGDESGAGRRSSHHHHDGRTCVY